MNRFVKKYLRALTEGFMPVLLAHVGWIVTQTYLDNYFKYLQ